MLVGSKQSVSPDDEHDMLETCRELYINILKGIVASSWTITKNHCMIHGQQNVKNIHNVCSLR